MKLKIKSIKDAGIVEKERLILKVLQEDDIGYYVVFKTTSFEDDSISNKVRYAYWFPDNQVRTGDLVILYTKSGRESKKFNPLSGITSHFFYWGLEKTIWNEKNDSAVLLEVKDWDNKRLSEKHIF